MAHIYIYIYAFCFPTYTYVFAGMVGNVEYVKTGKHVLIPSVTKCYLVLTTYRGCFVLEDPWTYPMDLLTASVRCCRNNKPASIRTEPKDDRDGRTARHLTNEWCAMDITISRTISAILNVIFWLHRYISNDVSATTDKMQRSTALTMFTFA